MTLWHNPMYVVWFLLLKVGIVFMYKQKAKNFKSTIVLIMLFRVRMKTIKVSYGQSYLPFDIKL